MKKKRARLDDVHESDEELRFFSQPPEPEPELSLAAPTSLSPLWRDDGEPALSPHALAHREARRDVMKRRVAWTLCGAVAILLLAAGAHQRSDLASVAPAARVAAAPPPVVASPGRKVVTPTPSVVTPAPSVVATPAPSVVAPAPSASEPSAATPSAATPSAAEPSAPAPSAPAPAPQVDASALIAKARNLLHSGHTREGVAAARDALSQAPEEAEPYVLLGAGLQDLGDYNGARETFAACVQKADHGPVASCRYFSRF